MSDEQKQDGVPTRKPQVNVLSWKRVGAGVEAEVMALMSVPLWHLINWSQMGYGRFFESWEDWLVDEFRGDGRVAKELGDAYAGYNAIECKGLFVDDEGVHRLVIAVGMELQG